MDVSVWIILEFWKRGKVQYDSIALLRGAKENNVYPYKLFEVESSSRSRILSYSKVIDML